MLKFNNQKKARLASWCVIILSLLLTIYFGIDASSQPSWTIWAIGGFVAVLLPFWIWPDYRFQSEIFRRLMSPWLWVPCMLILTTYLIQLKWPATENILYTPVIPAIILFALYKRGYIDKWKIKLFGNKENITNKANNH